MIQGFWYEDNIVLECSESISNNDNNSRSTGIDIFYLPKKGKMYVCVHVCIYMYEEHRVSGKTLSMEIKPCHKLLGLDKLL